MFFSINTRNIFPSLLFLSITICSAQHKPSNFIYYQEGEDIKLKMDVFFPKGYIKDKKYPCLVFYFGGGWLSGKTGYFSKQARYFASRGMICYLPQYRTKNSHQVIPKVCLQDAKTAMRFLKSNADTLSIDTSKIVAVGGSVGGHLAAAITFTTKINNSTDDLSISTVPNALILYNPIVDNGPEGYGYNRVKDYYLDFSPIHNITNYAPPTLFMLGTQDQNVTVSTAIKYKKKMNRIKSRCDMWFFPNQKRSFFNYNNSKAEGVTNYNYYKTIYEADKFLISLGFLEGEPTVEVPETKIEFQAHLEK